ncbi:MAG TPA: iron ABC transporter substrate-binding protein [Dehalococcoidia bacterium]|nr:iron ABC transporter substrate-binding protein [Dehalococcoidia bacterium]
MLAFLLLFGAACGGGDDGPSPEADPDPEADPEAAATTDLSGTSLVIYSGRSEALVGPLVQNFEKATGIKASVKYAGSAELAATLLEEGSRSPADVFWSQDPGPLGAVSSLLAKLPESLLSKVDARFRAEDGKWVGTSGRARVVVYNTDNVRESDLPTSILDFTYPKWKGRIGWAPTNSSLQAMVTTIRLLKGDAAAQAWLEGIKANGAKVYANNTAVVEAVGKGEVDVGFVNHYYLHAVRKSNPNIKAANFHLKNGDPGAVILASGAGVLASSKKQAQALRFIEYLLSAEAQKYFADQTFEYPLTGNVPIDADLEALAEIQSPRIDLSDLHDVQGTLTLMRRAGVIE